MTHLLYSHYIVCMTVYIYTYTICSYKGMSIIKFQKYGSRLGQGTLPRQVVVYDTFPHKFPFFPIYPVFNITRGSSDVSHLLCMTKNDHDKMSQKIGGFLSRF